MGGTNMLLQLASDKAPSGLSPPLQALWWLKKGGLAMGPEWRRAHEICQAREGEHAYDLVHALAHWIEGDASNADYWYRRAGEKRAGDVAAEWTRIAAALSA
jgi:TPR repeat protein